MLPPRSPSQFDPLTAMALPFKYLCERSMVNKSGGSCVARTDPYGRLRREKPTLESTPRDATHWSERSMAKATGITPTTVYRIWRAFSLQPHRSETFKLSRDPLFIEKVRDIVGLYLNPPEKAVVLCVDEK